MCPITETLRHFKRLGPRFAALAVAAALAGAAGSTATAQAGGATAPAPSPPSAAEHLDALLEPLRRRHDLPALGGAIVTGERLVALGATGVRRKGSTAAVRTTDRWHIGSCTKSMTATLLAVLVERGELRWDTTLAEVFDELAETMRPEYRAVRLDQLLAHRAGTPGYDAELWTEVRDVKGGRTRQREHIVRRVLSAAPANEPGTTYLYSNDGYVIAGAMAERVTGDAWEELMRRELFDPLGMASAGFGTPGERRTVDEPWGHEVRARGVRAVPPGPMGDNPAAVGPAGTVHCSLADWAEYVQMHLRASHADAEDGEGPELLLEPETFRKLHVPAKGWDYALGWGAKERAWAEGRVLTHTGSNNHWFSVVWIAPKLDFAVLVTTNQGGSAAAKAADEAAWALIQHHLGRDR